MENLGKDVLSVILTHVPLKLLEVISSDNALLRSNIDLTRDDNSFWKKRAEVLLGKQLNSRRTNWRSVYTNLEKTSTVDDPLLYWINMYGEALNNKYIVDTVSVLLEIGYDPSVNNNEAIATVSYYGYTEIAKLLLQDPRVDPSANNNLAIRNASGHGHTKIVELLLQDSRVNPSDYYNHAIVSASRGNAVEIVKLLLQDPRVDPSANNNRPILNASYHGHTEIVKLLLQDPRVDPSANDNESILWAADKGYTEIVKLLLQHPRVDPSANNNEAIRFACIEGHIEIVELLLKDPRVDPSANDNIAIQSASEKGYVEIVKLLLQDPRVDPSDNNNLAIRNASYHGHTEIVKLLLQDPRVDPSVNDNTAIQGASEKGYVEIVKLLLQDPRVDASDNNNLAIRNASYHGHTEILKLFLQSDVLDEKAIKTGVEEKKLSVYIREYIKDSLSGLLAMHFLYQNVNTKHIYKDPTENKENFIGLYYQFLRYLVRTVPSMYGSVTYLTSLISRKDINSKLIILESVKNVLYHEKNAFTITKQNPYISIFTGYFMLSFDPPYTYREILTRLKDRHKDIIYLTAKLIGAKIGLKRLIENGLHVSTEVNVKIKNALKIDLIDILN